MIKNYEALLNKIMTQEELAEACKTFTSEQEFVIYLLSLPIINRHDWAEESMDTPIHEFINKRLKAFGVDTLKLERATYWDNFTKYKANPKRGDWMIYALACYDASIKRHGYRLILADTLDDTYRIMVVEKANATKLHQIKSEQISFKYVN